MIETRSSLMIQLRQGRHGPEWSEFAEIYYPFLRYLVVRAGIPADDANDVVQDLFLLLLRVLPQFDKSRGRLRAWLKVIVRNRVIDWFRNRQRQEVGLESTSWLAEENDEFEQVQLVHILRTALEVIRQESHETTWRCFERHALQQATAREVAQELGVTENSVYVNSSRILSRVREYCAQYGEDHSCRC